MITAHVHEHFSCEKRVIVFALLKGCRFLQPQLKVGFIVRFSSQVDIYRPLLLIIDLSEL